jgi:hypothetical protein
VDRFGGFCITRLVNFGAIGVGMGLGEILSAFGVAIAARGAVDANITAGELLDAIGCKSISGSSTQFLKTPLNRINNTTTIEAQRARCCPSCALLPTDEG